MPSIEPVEPSAVPLRQRWDGQLMARDLALRGWSVTEFATRAGLTFHTAAKFLSGQTQTNRIGPKLARALGKRPERYLLDGEPARRTRP